VLCLFGDGSFSLTGWDFETCVRFGLPFIGVVGNNSHMNQIRYGQIQKYGKERGDIGNKLGDVRWKLSMTNGCRGQNNYPRLKIPVATWRASAMIVQDGFTPGAVGNKLESAT